MREQAFQRARGEAVGEGAHREVAQRARERVLELAHPADAARLGLDEERAASPARDPCGQRLRERPLRELVREHDGVLERHRRALSHVRRRGVRGVAYKDDAIARPRPLHHLLEVVSQELVGTLELREHLGDVPAEGRELGAEALDAAGGRIGRRRRCVSSREEVERAVADRHESEAAAATPHLDLAIHAGGARDDTAPARVAGVARRVRAEDELAHRGANPVRADDEVVAGFAPIGAAHAYFFAALLDRDGCRAEADATSVTAVEQRLVQRRAVKRDAAPKAPTDLGEVHLGQRAPTRVRDRGAEQRGAAPRHRIRAPDRAEHPHRVRGENDPGTDRRPRRRALDHVRLSAAAPKCSGERESRDSSADDQDSARGMIRHAVKLATFQDTQGVRIGVVEGDEIVDLAATSQSPFLRDMCEFLAAGEPALRLARDAAGSSRARLPLASVVLTTPIARPRKFLAVGLNYADHAAEGGREAPWFPVIFNKQVSCVNGPYDPIWKPRASDALDYEGELAFAIGRRCRRVARARAHEVIAGFLVCNDVSVRDWQARSQTLTLGKSWDTHGPLGPWLTTPDEVGDPHSLKLRTWVNGELRQNASTKQLLFDCYALVETLSTVFTLEPGDVVSTGTPAGVAIGFKPPRFLRTGDVVRIEIEKLGWIENSVDDEP